MMSGLIQQLNNIGFAQDFILKAVFYAVAAFSVFFALRTVTSRNVFHSAIFLALTLIGVACVFLYLDAEFLAIIQILIYVGAITILIIFAIMLTARIQDRAIRQTNRQVPVSAVIALGFFILFLNIIKKSPWQAAVEKPQTLSLAQLGSSLMTNFALPFEVISLVLLVALVGAIVIGKVGK